MTDVQRLPDPVPAILRLPRGTGVVLREPDDRLRARRAPALVRLCRSRGLRLLVAADWRLAATSAAGGLHLPEAIVSGGDRRWRRARRPGRVVTAAAHSARAIRRAAAAGVDAVLVSPVFATRSHPGRPPLGPLRFARLVRGSPLPVFALGGLDAESARRLSRSGAAGFAAVGGLAAD